MKILKNETQKFYSGGFCLGGFCPGDLSGGLCPGGFVLEPYDRCLSVLSIPFLEYSALSSPVVRPQVNKSSELF